MRDYPEMVASMRPRVFPAEDLKKHLGVHRNDDASMRPRVFPAEDWVTRINTTTEALLQ